MATRTKKLRADGARERDRGHEAEACAAIGAFEHVDVEATAHEHAQDARSNDTE